MKTYLLSEQLLQQVGTYLITRPYREVAALIDALSKLPVSEPPREKE